MDYVLKCHLYNPGERRVVQQFSENKTCLHGSITITIQNQITVMSVLSLEESTIPDT